MIRTREENSASGTIPDIVRADEFSDRPWAYRDHLANSFSKARTLHEGVSCGGKGGDDIAKLIKKFGVDARDSLGRTPAMVCGHFFYVDLLLAHGADPLAKDLAGNTLLMYYWPNLSERLLGLGVDINAKNIFGHSLFYFAVSNGWDVIPLLEAGATWETIPNHLVDRFFIDNVRHGRIPVLSRLIRDKTPSQKTFNMSRIWAAIHSSEVFEWLGGLCSRYQKTTVRHLWPEQIEDLKETLSFRGCDCLPRMLTCLDTDDDIRKIVAQTNSPAESFLKGDMPSEQLELLLRLGADPNLGVNWKDNTDITPPLYDAVAASSVINVQTLLDYGANASTGTTYMDTDCTCLGLAVARCNETILRMLIRAGADLNMSLRGNRTPLITAMMGNNEKFVRILLAAGADPSISYEKGRSITDYFNILHRKPVTKKIRKLILAALDKQNR